MKVESVHTGEKGEATTHGAPLGFLTVRWEDGSEQIVPGAALRFL